jgi:valyl-tRNA synthetase
MIQIKESGFDHLTKTDSIHETDLAFSANLGLLIQKTTQAFDSFDYAAALDATEQLFWKFCDDYIELVKVRAYKDPEVSHRRSAIATLYIALGLFLRLFSPFLPFITEEVGATLLGDEFSIHKSQWPHVSELPDTLANSALFDWVSLMLSEIRAAKTQAQKAMKYPIKKAQITVQNQSMAQSLQPIFPDIINAGSIQELSVDVNSEIPLLTLQVQLASDIVA